MKNKFLIGLLSAGVILSGTAAVSASFNDNKGSEKDIISEKEAIGIAEKAVNGKVVEIELDEDDNQYVYESELELSNGESEVEINAVTGEVLGIDNDYDDASEEDTPEEDAGAFTDNWTSFPEHNKITEELDHQDYNVKIVTDNQWKRILLFVDNDGEEQYKSIFVKETNRLKLIDLNGGLVFNDILK